MGITISHRVRRDIREAARTYSRRFLTGRDATVAEAGERQTSKLKSMKNNASPKKLEIVPLSTDAPTGTTLDELLRSSKPVGELAAVQQQVNRILDLWADRTRAVLASLDISVGDFSASWHPCGDLTGLAEKLSHVEITLACPMFCTREIVSVAQRRS
jgi:hypothetical protein